MRIDRMALADIGEPARLASAILDQLPDVPIPVPVEDIARALDITDIRTLETEGFEGGLITPRDKSEGVILVNAHSPRQRRRFTIGHELGHFVNPWHMPTDGRQSLCTPADMRRSTHKTGDRAVQMEVEANRFSAEVLLPRTQFQKDLGRRAGADLEHVVSLADRYDMSKEATARRYVDLHDEPCAVVFSHNAIVRYTRRGSGFHYLDIKGGNPLPAQSLSAKGQLPEGVVSEWREIDSGMWLSDVPRARSIFEQTLAQQNGYRITLLTFDEADADEDDEPEDLEESWTPRFRRR